MPRPFRSLLVLALALLAAACDSDATGPADLRLVGVWSAGPTPMSVSSGTPVPGFYVYTLSFDPAGGYLWEAAVYGGPGARPEERTAYVRVSGTVTAEGSELRFHPTFSVARSRTGQTPAPLLAVPGAGDARGASYLLVGNRMVMGIDQGGGRTAGQVNFRRAHAK
jgi:hypothetical protein